jgi:hypothetical protein
MRKSTPIAPSGAYLRSMAWKLMFRAAFRYFSDSERSEVERWDIPAAYVKTLARERYAEVRTV